MPKKAHKNSHLVGQEVTLTGKVDRVVGHDGVWCWVRLRASENVVKVHVRDLTLRTGTGVKPEPPKTGHARAAEENTCTCGEVAMTDAVLGQHIVNSAPLPSLPVPPPPPVGLTDKEAAAFLDTFTGSSLADPRRTTIA